VLVGSHRTFTHSVSFAVLVGAACALAAPRWRLPPLRTGAVCTIAYGSHVLLDWSEELKRLVPTR